MTGRDAHVSELDRYLQMIVGDRRGHELLEVRYAGGSRGMRRAFVAANRPDRAARLIRTLWPPEPMSTAESCSAPDEPAGATLSSTPTSCSWKSTSRMRSAALLASRHRA